MCECMLESTCKSHDVVCLYGYVYISEYTAVSGSPDGMHDAMN